MENGGKMRGRTKTMTIAVGIIALLLFVGWAGFKVKPSALPAIAEPQPELKTVPLPAGLPAPVERYYTSLYGDRVPLIETAVISGRGWMKPLGFAVPIRFRFTHEAGKNFRHDIDLTFMGITLARAKETYIDGKGWAKTPGGIEEGRDFEQGSLVSMWAEAFNWFPAVLVTDPQVKWVAVDDKTALIRVPYGEKDESFVVRFDPETGKPTYFEAIKYNSQKKKPMLWIGGVWFEDGKPWINLDVEQTVLNIDVKDRIRE